MTLFDIRKKRLEKQLKASTRRRKVRAKRFKQEQELKALRKQIKGEEEKFDEFGRAVALKPTLKKVGRGAKVLGQGVLEVGGSIIRAGSKFRDFATDFDKPKPKVKGKKKRRQTPPGDGTLLRTLGFN